MWQTLSPMKLNNVFSRQSSLKAQMKVIFENDIELYIDWVLKAKGWNCKILFPSFYFERWFFLVCEK
jgi:hypothetical protein